MLDCGVAYNINLLIITHMKLFIKFQVSFKGCLFLVGGMEGVFLRFAVGRGACLASRGWRVCGGGRVCLRGKVAGCSSEAGVFARALG